MVSRVEDRWFSKRKDSNGKRTKKTTHGIGNRWMAVWDDLDGKERTQKFVTREQALAHLEQISSQKVTGTYINNAAGKRFIGELITEWDQASVHWKPSTRNAAESDIRAYLRPYWGDWTIGAVRKRDVQEWVNSIKQAPRTVQTIHGRFVTFLNWCIEENVIAKNPASKVNVPTGRAREHVFLDHAQVSALAEAMPERYRSLVWLQASCGLRIGETVELRVKDIDLSRLRIRVERSVVFVKGGAPVVGPPKNGKARTVPITPFMASLLRTHLVGKSPDRFVFMSARGFQIRPNNFKRRDFDKAIIKANELAAARRASGQSAVALPTSLWVHDLRHTAASWLVSSGASVKAVQRMLGHAKASITLDIYAGLFDQDLDDLAERMQRMLGEQHLAA